MFLIFGSLTLVTGLSENQFLVAPWGSQHGRAAGSGLDPKLLEVLQSPADYSWVCRVLGTSKCSGLSPCSLLKWSS